MVGEKKVRFLNHVFDAVDDFPVNEKVDVVVRPEDVILKVVKEPSKEKVTGKIVTKVFKGVHYEMCVMARGFEFVVHSTDCFAVDSRVGIHVDPFDIQIMHKAESDDEKAVEINE